MHMSAFFLIQQSLSTHREINQKQNI